MLSQRKYKNYKAYLEHQARKLDRTNPEVMRKYNLEYQDELFGRLREDGLRSGSSALCLGARLGAEVKAFIDLGCFAVGMDLNPGKANRYVVTGNFMEIQYPDSCVDIVFTNCIDHTYDLDKFISEAHRVLKPGGSFILDVVNGKREGVEPGAYEVQYWDKTEEVLQKMKDLKLIRISPFNYPWKGTHVHFKKEAPCQ